MVEGYNKIISVNIKQLTFIFLISSIVLNQDQFQTIENENIIQLANQHAQEDAIASVSVPIRAAFTTASMLFFIPSTPVFVLVAISPEENKGYFKLPKDRKSKFIHQFGEIEFDKYKEIYENERAIIQTQLNKSKQRLGSIYGLSAGTATYILLIFAALQSV